MSHVCHIIYELYEHPIFYIFYNVIMLCYNVISFYNVIMCYYILSYIYICTVPIPAYICYIPAIYLYLLPRLFAVLFLYLLYRLYVPHIFAHGRTGSSGLIKSIIMVMMVCMYECKSARMSRHEEEEET